MRTQTTHRRQPVEHQRREDDEFRAACTCPTGTERWSTPPVRRGRPRASCTWMEHAGGREEEVVARHGVIHARSGQNEAVLHPNVEIMIAAAMSSGQLSQDGLERGGSDPSCGALAIATRAGRSVGDVREHVQDGDISTPAPMAPADRAGRSDSPSREPTLFHASIENSEPTIAAPSPQTHRGAAGRQKLTPKLAANASASGRW